MSRQLKLIAFGDAVGLVLPAELLARWRMGEGDVLTLTETDLGFTLTPKPNELAQQLALGREFVEEFGETFLDLGKQ